MAKYLILSLLLAGCASHSNDDYWQKESYRVQCISWARMTYNPEGKGLLDQLRRQRQFEQEPQEESLPPEPKKEYKGIKYEGIPAE